MPRDLVAQLKQAVEGLLYPSESDEPFKVFCWKGNETDPASVIAAQVEPGMPIQSQTVADFFGELQGSDDAKRFNDLRRLLEISLTRLSVFRAGSVEVGIYVMGQAGGQWIGIQTMSVET